jgi:AraC family transcriptional regulator, regulatory protein of adaptative response / methylated-DNA-[protein]-cysteine methyltransferase
MPDPLRYDLLPCPLGRVLIAIGDTGALRAVFLGDEDELLVQALQHRWGAAHRTALPASASALVLRAIDNPARLEEVPLPPGTPFQQLVWHALQQLPAGRTTSYAALAAAAGQPRAVRAVASACGANPLAVLVPCHRVLRGDGGLGGYRWGLARKRWLLEREGVSIAQAHD